MHREYRYIKEYEKEILRLKEQGMTLRKSARSMAKYTTLFHGTTHDNANWRQE